MQRLMLAVLAASLGLAGSAHAQRAPQASATSSRLVLNGHSTAALGTSVGDEFGSIDTRAGLGAGVEVGYLITPRLMAYAGVDIVKQDVDVVGLEGDFGLTHLEAGARLSFPLAHSKMVPYVGAWVGRRRLSTTAENLDTGERSELSMSGIGIGGTAGLQVFVAPTLALDGGISVGTGRMGNVRVDGERQDWGTPDRTTTTRIRFGANWYP
jgi:hypothetical protein